MTGTQAPPAVRLQRRLAVRDSGCIEWTGHTANGYGYIKVGAKDVRTHRLAWELANGRIADGLNVLHTCDNRPCCNVEHLFLGTQAENLADMAAKGRGANGRADLTHCPQDHPYDEVNTYVIPRGGRDCRICRRAAGARRRDRRTS